ncbi:uncharacterized protein LOC125519598 [Triticum urartu]|uniref:uncharacterized protein LOC125519598 n=1 Tax=Triticum urartu TaxID=4572 RepID=UPI0020449E31|nr:uncharacterized protein LOC125519598 [Triticum urartu]
MAESAIGSVLGNVSTLAVQETTFLCGVNLEVGFLKDELKRLKSYLKSADTKRRSGDELVATWVSQIRDAAYEAQNAIEAADYMEKRNRLKKGFMGAISRYARLPSDLITLHTIGAEIQRVKRKISEITDSANQWRRQDFEAGYSLAHKNTLNLFPTMQKSYCHHQSHSSSSSTLQQNKEEISIYKLNQLLAIIRTVPDRRGEKNWRWSLGWAAPRRAMGGWDWTLMNSRRGANDGAGAGQPASDERRGGAAMQSVRIHTNTLSAADGANRLKINLDNSDLEKVHIEDEYPQDYGIMHQNYEDIDLVGFGDEYKEIVGKLVDKEDITLSAVSIVAMGGAGKTTLARKVYTSSSVKQHFEATSWVTVSQKFKGIDLLKDIMKQIMNIFANMPHLVDICLYRFGVLDKLPAEFPQSVRRLVLFANVLKQDPMPILEKFPRLVVLELGGYKGQTMCCSSQGFPRLQELETSSFFHRGVEDGGRGNAKALPPVTLGVREDEQAPRGVAALGHLKLYYMPQISEDDSTRKELQQKGCEVEIRE